VPKIEFESSQEERIKLKNFTIDFYHLFTLVDFLFPWKQMNGIKPIFLQIFLLNRVSPFLINFTLKQWPIFK